MRILPFLFGWVLLIAAVGCGFVLESPISATEPEEPEIITSAPVAEVVMRLRIVPTPTATPFSTPTAVPLDSPELAIGAFLPDFPPTRNLVAFEEKIGRRIDILSWFQKWSDPPVTNKLRLACARGAAPLITWEPWRGRNKGSYAMQDIAEGRYDELVKESLLAISQACDQEVYLRFAHEMNTPRGKVWWYPWQGDPLAYRWAWKRVVRLSREIGAGNLRWVWTPAWGNEDAILYYPGADFVDFVGVTVLNFGPVVGPWRSFPQLFDPQYEALARFRKPIILAEVGSAEQGGDKAEWIRGMFSSLRTDFPLVSAVVWFNNSRAREFAEIDWRVESSPESLKAFREALVNQN